MAKYITNFRAGDTKKLKVSYATDITTYQFRFTLVDDFGNTPVLQVTTTAGDDAADIPDEGLCYITIESTDTNNIPAGKYYYYLERIIPGTPDDIYTVMPPSKDYKDKVEVIPK